MLRRSVAIALVASVALIEVSALHAVDPPMKAATAEQASAVLNLAEFPLVDGADELAHRDIAEQSYLATTSVKAAFESLQKNFLDRHWKTVGEPYVSDDSCNLTVQNQGYLVTISVNKRDPETASIAIHNLGNIDASKLPVPKGLKSLFQIPGNAAYLSERSVDETRAEARKLLLAAGWEPYGEIESSFDVKQNAVTLGVRVAQAPAQGNKTVIHYATQLRSIDLPAPHNAKIVQYADTTRGLFTETALSQDEVVKFYRDRLGKHGWKPTTDQTFKLEIYQAMIFRNAAQEMLTLKLIDFEGKTRAMIEYLSAERIAKLDEEAEKLRAKKKAEKDRPLPKVVIKNPKGATVESNTKQKIEFQVARGAKLYVETLAAEFKKEGWKIEATIAEEMAGEYTFQKGDQELHVSYLDTGILPGEITVSAFRGAELELSSKK